MIRPRSHADSMPMPTLPSPGAQVRPEEILSWLKAWQGEPIEAWCAVDDRPLLMERGGAGLIGHFVEVDEMFGLTERAVERVLAVLHTEVSVRVRVGVRVRGGLGPNPSRR